MYPKTPYDLSQTIIKKAHMKDLKSSTEWLGMNYPNTNIYSSLSIHPRDDRTIILQTISNIQACHDTIPDL